MLSFDVQQPNPYYGQIVIVTKSYEIRNEVQAKLQQVARDNFIGTDILVKALELGPPVGRPIQYRVSGPDIQTLRKLALEFAGVIDTNPNVTPVTYDWMEPARVLKVDVMQDKARQLGVTSQDIAQTLNSVVSGVTATQVRDQTYLVNVIGRSVDDERRSIETIQNLQIQSGAGRSYRSPRWPQCGTGWSNLRSCAAVANRRSRSRPESSAGSSRTRSRNGSSPPCRHSGTDCRSATASTSRVLSNRARRARRPSLPWCR